MTAKKSDTSAASEMAQALVEAIELTRPMQKKTIFNRTSTGPYAPKKGEKKLKFRRAHYQHAIRLFEENLTNEEIALFNKVRPGSYCGGHVKVILRKDRGIDLTYPVKTASQRLKLVNQFGITDLASMLTRCIAEASQPKPVEVVDEE